MPSSWPWTRGRWFENITNVWLGEKAHSSSRMRRARSWSPPVKFFTCSSFNRSVTAVSDATASRTRNRLARTVACCSWCEVTRSDLCGVTA